MFGAAAAGGIDAFEANGVGGREALDQRGAAEEFEVIEAFVAGELAWVGNGNGASEQQPARVTIVTGALGDAGPSGDECGVEGVLQ